MKSNSTFQKPSVFQSLGNGTTHYNYNIVEETKSGEQDGENVLSYDYDQVTIVGAPTYSKTVSAVIREKYTIDKELSLINNYNRYMSAAESDKVEKHKTEYFEYLEDTSSIKASVKSDCLAYNVEIDD